jgi:hypothetical protein
MKRYLFLAVVLLTVAASAWQCSPTLATAPSEAESGPEIVITDPFARASIPNGAVFMTLTNEGGQDDRLLSADTAVAETVELHESKMDENGVMRMSPIPNVPIPAGDSATLEPGGKHIMLLGLKETLAAGDTFSLTLNFETSPSQTIDVAVQDSLMGHK